MKAAVVTGAAGFIGAAVARALESERFTVYAAGTSSAADPLTPERVAALPAFELLVHCAGSSSVGASLQDPERELAKTVPPLQAVLDHVRTKQPHARVVLLSSAAVYGNAARVPTPETCPAAPVSAYGEHKRMCEELCVASGIAAVIVRLFSVYGPGLRKQLLWDACRKADRGELTFAGTGDEERDWLHIDDAAALIVRAAQEASASVPIFNGASGAGVRVRDVVGQIYRELGAGQPQFSGAARAGDPQRYVGDITRARALGWSPRILIERGIAQYVAWYREQA
jgi:UDP-glucose 4-epimerase